MTCTCTPVAIDATSSGLVDATVVVVQHETGCPASAQRVTQVPGLRPELAAWLAGEIAQTLGEDPA